MQITGAIKYIGVNDHKIDLFEGQYRVPNGMAYNSYVIIDEEIAVLDTVERDFVCEWLGNLERALDGRTPDYLIVQHMEPDHSAGIMTFLERYPSARVIASQAAFRMMRGFFGTDFEDRRRIVTEGDVLTLGTHSLTFITAPMVHWPEVIMTYDSTDRVLFSADAFGRFGALDVDEPWLDEARRYYIGIVGKYGKQVEAVLKKAASLDIRIICSLHGPILREDIDYYIGKYATFAAYEAEEKGVTIAYASIYGNTAEAARLLAEELASKGVKVSLYDLARCDKHAALADAFRYDRLVLAASTYNAGVFPPMREFIAMLAERGYKNRRVALIENGSWAPTAAKVMREALGESVDYLADPVRITSSVSDATADEIRRLANTLSDG